MAGGGGGGGIGFLSDARRLNVAITRARTSLHIVCNAEHLSRCDPNWRDFIVHSRTFGRYALIPSPGGGGASSGLQAVCGELEREVCASTAALRRG